VRAEPLEPRTLLANIALPLGQGVLPSDLVYDPDRDLLYVSTNAKTIECYDVVAGRMLQPLRLDENAGGFDLTPDGSTFYAGGTRLEELLKINAATGDITPLRFQRFGGEGNVTDVIIPANGKVLFGVGVVNSPNRNLHELDPASGAATLRNDVSAGAVMSRSPDRSTAVFLPWEGDISNRGPVSVYDSATNRLVTSYDTFTRINPSQAGFTSTASQFAIHSFPGSKVYDRANLFSPRQSLPEVDGAMIFDPTRPVFYGVNTTTDQFIAYDTTATPAWRELYRFPVGEDVGGTGTNAISKDGSRIFLITPQGVRVIDVPRPTGDAWDFRGGGFSTFVRKGVTSTFTLDVRDPVGNPAVNYRGTVHFSSDDPSAELPTDYTFTAADAGKHTFTLTLNTPGTRSITARDVGRPELTLTQSAITVHAGNQAFVPVAGGQELIYDPVHDRLYVTTASGAVQGFDVGDESLLRPIQAGVTLSGGDVTPDGSTLYVADAQVIPYNPSPPPGTVRKIDLASGNVTTLSFPLQNGERAAADVAVAANGRAIVTTSTYVNSATVRPRQIDLASGAVSTRADHAGFFFNSFNGADTRVTRGADRRTLLFQSLAFTLDTEYDATTDSFPDLTGSVGGRPAAISPDSQLMAFQYLGTVITDGALRTVTKFAPVPPGSSNPYYGPQESGMLFDPARDVFYAVDGVADQVVAYDTRTWREKYRIPVGENVGYAERVGPGQMAASKDGHKLFLLTAAGVRVINTPRSDGVAATFELSGFPALGPAGRAGTVTLTARDAAGDPATGYRGTVHFSSSDPDADLPADYTFTAGDGGTKTFTVTFHTPGTHTLTAVDVAPPQALRATQAGIVVHGGSVSLIPETYPRDIVFDPARDVLYVSTAAGKVLRYDLATRTLLSPLDAGVPLNGIDLSLDGSSLFAAEDIFGVRTNVIRRFDLPGSTPGTYSAVHIGPDDGTTGAFDVAAAANGTVLITVKSDRPSNSPNPFREFDAATGTLRIRSQFDWIYQGATLAPAGDRSAVLVVDHDAYNTRGIVRLYDSANPAATMPARYDDAYRYGLAAAASPDGSRLVARGIATDVLDRSLNFVRNLPGIDGGMAFDPTRPVFYGVDTAHKQIVAFDTGTWRELYRMPTGVQFMASAYPMMDGMTAVSDDGRWLFLTVLGQGVRIYPLRDPPPTGVAGRYVFYNDSAFDGRDPSANADDDDAIATDKRPLLGVLAPGQPVTRDNYTSYSRGLNGVMFDLVGVDAAGDVSADDVRLEMANPASPGVWVDAPVAAVSVRRGDGASGSARVTLTWTDDRPRNTWLRVTVKPTTMTGLAAADVFYFGNLVGEVAGPTSPPAVDVDDFTAARAAVSTRPAALADRFDFNHDGRVNVLDVAIARASLGHALPIMTAPAPATPSFASTPATPTPTRRAPPRATGLLRE
jgi:sugar lactone lactonase YvrE